MLMDSLTQPLSLVEQEHDLSMLLLLELMLRILICSIQRPETSLRKVSLHTETKGPGHLLGDIL